MLPLELRQLGTHEADPVTVAIQELRGFLIDHEQRFSLMQGISLSTPRTIPMVTL